MSGEEESTGSAPSSSSSSSPPLFDAGRLLWLCRARQMDSERDQLKRVERWKKLSDTAAATSKEELVMAMKEDAEALPALLLDTSVGSDVSFSSSSSTIAEAQQEESAAAVTQDNTSTEYRSSRQVLSSLSEARPETLEALRSLACKYNSEIHSSRSISLYHSKAYLERTNSSRPPFLKRASSATTTAQSLDDDSMDESQQDDNVSPVLKLECLIHCQQLESFSRTIELSQWNDLEDERRQDRDEIIAFPYRAVLGAVAMLLAAGFLVVTTRHYKISNGTLQIDESSNQVLAKGLMAESEQKVGTVLTQSPKVEVVPSIGDNSSVVISNELSTEMEWLTVDLPRGSSILKTNNSMRLGHRNKLMMEDLEQCNEGRLVPSKYHDEGNDSKHNMTTEGSMTEAVATRKHQGSSHRWRDFRNDAISEVARFVAKHRRDKRRAPSKKTQRNRYPKRIKLKQWFGKIVANNVDESWAS